MKSGNLNFLETSGPQQACNGTALPFYKLGVVLLIMVNMCATCFVGNAILQLQNLNHGLFLLEWIVTP